MRIYQRVLFATQHELFGDEPSDAELLRDVRDPVPAKDMHGNFDTGPDDDERFDVDRFDPTTDERLPVHLLEDLDMEAQEASMAMIAGGMATKDLERSEAKTRELMSDATGDWLRDLELQLQVISAELKIRSESGCTCQGKPGENDYVTCPVHGGREHFGSMSTCWG